MLANYHTHTQRCGHAIGEDREYIEQAVKNGFGILGFSDHCPWVFPADYVSDIVRSLLIQSNGIIYRKRIFVHDKNKHIHSILGIIIEEKQSVLNLIYRIVVLFSFVKQIVAVFIRVFKICSGLLPEEMFNYGTAYQKTENKSDQRYGNNNKCNLEPQRMSHSCKFLFFIHISNL